MAIANAVDASQQGTQYLSTGGQWSGVDASTSGFVLTSNGTGVAPSFQSSSIGATTGWTPNLQFGGANVGITYTTQSGWYVQIGDLVFFQFDIVLSSKGSSVGTATISNLPVTAGATSVATNGNVAHALVTFPVGTTYLNSSFQSAGTVLTFIAYGSATTMVLADTNFANTSQIVGSGFYTVA